MDERKLKVVPGEVEWDLEDDGRLVGKATLQVGECLMETTYELLVETHHFDILVETHHLDGRVYPAPRLVEEDDPLP